MEFRRLPRVRWTEYRTNDSILEQLKVREKPNNWNGVVKLKPGRPITIFKDNIKELINTSMVQVYRMVQDRREGRQYIIDATADHSNDLSV